MGTANTILNAAGTEPATQPANPAQQLSQEVLAVLAGPVIAALNAIKTNPTWENVVVQFPALAATETAQLPSVQGDAITAAADFLLTHLQQVVPAPAVAPAAATAPATGA